MGLVVVPFAEAFTSLLLFDGTARDVHHHLHLHRVMPPAETSSIVANPPRSDSAKLYRYQEGVFGNGGGPKSSATSMGSQYAWNLPNGRVEFDRPLSFSGVSMQDGRLASGPASSSVSLWDPVLLGSGGSGAVFSFSTHSNAKDQNINVEEGNVAIKVSWKRPRASVENECNILQSLANVPHVERCLGRPNPYPYEEGRVTIALTPVVTSDASEITSSLQNVKMGEPQRAAVRSVVETMVGMLRAEVYTIDVQPLISVDSGDTQFIDFTEARPFSNPLTALDESALVGFCSEMLALVPEPLRDVAAQCLRTELNALNRNDAPLPEKVVDILESTWLD